MEKTVNVKGVFFAYGGVVEGLKSDQATFLKGVHILSDMLDESGIHMETDGLAHALREGQKSYERW
jgi:hypothetical protein